MPSVYKTSDEAYISLKENFEKRIGDSTQTGSVIDIFNKVIGDECRDMYKYIKDSFDPYLFTNTYGEDLDSLGYWVNLPRHEDEDDSTYKYRLKDWMLTAEASNTKAIENGLLNTEHSSSITYKPFTKGSGTSTCYVIPKEYSEEVIANALAEAEDLIKGIVSPSLYIEYIVPTMRAVSMTAYLVTDSDSDAIKQNITKAIADYVNNIAPGEFLKLGDLVKIGINESGVEYFNITTLIIDNITNTEIQVVQELETKFIFDNITFVGKSN